MSSSPSTLVRILLTAIRIIGPIVGLVNRWQERVFHARMKPIIEAKIKKQKEADDPQSLQERLKANVRSLEPTPL